MSSVSLGYICLTGMGLAGMFLMAALVKHNMELQARIKMKDFKGDLNIKSKNDSKK